MITLARCRRIEGWVPEPILRAQFAAVSAVARECTRTEHAGPLGPSVCRRPGGGSRVAFGLGAERHNLIERWMKFC